MTHLRVGDGQRATLKTAEDRPDVVRVAIERCTTETRYDIQVSLSGLPLVAGHTYVLSFLARSDRPRPIGVGAARSQAPWSNLGFYEEVALTTEWQNWEHRFTATDHAADARIHFDVGGHQASVEISGVYVRSLENGRVLTVVRPTSTAAADRGEACDTVPFGHVDFGSLRRRRPIGSRFGVDRGTPIDRHYVEQFLERHRATIRGRVLEVGDRTYTGRFGGDAVTHSDVLDVRPEAQQATIVADLTHAPHIPSESFDCIILTQTLQLIYDLDAAVTTLHRILKPGGVLLATFPGITQTDDADWGSSWCWSFTTVSAKRLFGGVFDRDHVEVESFGNVLAATAFLQGLAKEELTPGELDEHDPAYDVTVTVRATKVDASEVEPATTESTAAPAVVGNPASPCTVSVLTYHRVTDDAVDPWSLSVSPPRFAQHMATVRQYATPLRLDEALVALREGRLDRPGVVITFDDGYADNLHAALPVLERFEVPATFFVTSGAIDRRDEFWWDALEWVVLGPHRLPDLLELPINGRLRQWQIGEATSSVRRGLFMDLWQLLQSSSDGDRRQHIGRLREWAGVAPSLRRIRRTLSTPELQELAASPLAAIGAHTVTHPRLTGLSYAEQTREIVECKRQLERVIGVPVNAFSYPFGDQDAVTRRLVGEAGFHLACSTVPSRTTAATDALEIPRLPIREQTSLRELWA